MCVFFWYPILPDFVQRNTDYYYQDDDDDYHRGMVLAIRCGKLTASVSESTRELQMEKIGDSDNQEVK